jgi:hypothetical protein
MVAGFHNLPNLSSRNMALGLIQPVIEMSTMNLPREVKPERHADKFTAIYKPIV